MTDRIENLDDFTAFGAFFRRTSDENRHSMSAIVSADINYVKSVISGTVSIDSPVSDEGTLDQNNVDNLSPLATKIRDVLKSLTLNYETIELMRAVMAAMPHFFFKNRIEKYAEDKCIVLDDLEDGKIYGLSEPDFLYLNKNIDRWRNLDQGISKIPSLLLLGVVASYDLLFSDITKILLSLKPERYEGSNKSYTISQIRKFSSFDDLLNSVIDAEVEALMYENHQKQIEFFSTTFSVGIKDSYDKWPEFIEIFERRNIIAHSGSIANDIYLENCERVKYPCEYEKGQFVTVDLDYVENALNLLTEFAILLIFRAWHKQQKDSIEDSFHAIVTLSFDLLVDNKPVVASRILSNVRIFESQAGEEFRLMLLVNHAIAKKMIDDPDWEILLRSENWSTKSPLFQLCVSAVLEKVDEVIIYMPICVGMAEIGSDGLRQWPCFQWIRDHELFVQKFTEIFNEPLVQGGQVMSEGVVEEI